MSTSDFGRHVFSNQDKSLVFEVSESAHGVFVTRIQRWARSGTTSYTHQLPDLATFDTLVSREQARFQEQQLFVQLRRALQRLFDRGLCT